jgi:lysophospholipase L1-like esterase
MKKVIGFILLIAFSSCEKTDMRIFNSQNKKKLSLENAVIVCDGNSLTQGTGASNPATTSYPARIDASAGFETATIYNLGVSGQTTQQMIDDAVGQVNPLYNASVSNVLIAWEVGNDLYYNGNVSAAMSRFWSYCDARRAVGFKVIVVTCPPRDQATTFGDNSAQYNTKLNEANALILSDYTSHADGVVDLASDSRFAGYNLTYYDADKVHFTDAGYQVIADLIKNRIINL